MPFKVQDPDATITWTLDWSDWLGTDTIASATYTLQTGLTSVATSETTTTTSQKVTVDAGNVGNILKMSAKPTTTTGAEIPERSITLAIEQR